MIKRNRILLFTSILIICIFGLIMIYSSSNIWAIYKYNDPYKFVKMQSLFFFIGLVIIYILYNIDYHILKRYSNIILFISILLLILVLIPGIGTIRNGSRSWFGIGSLGVQPSEFAKLGLIIFTSKYLSNNIKDIKNIKKGLIPIILVILLTFILIMLEPDFGTSMVLILTLITMLLISGLDLSFFLKLGFFGVLSIILLIIKAPYRLKRILSFINPWSDPLGSGYQIIQSLYAIGPGGLLGQGFMNSRQKYFYLPESHTDFIFSIISEEFGFLGILIISTLFIIIFYNSIKISLSTNDLFGKFLSFGLSVGLIIQTLLNLAVTSGLLPVTGITLPFISYGGSSLLVSMISIGIILNISRGSNK